MVCPYCSTDMEPIELNGKVFCSNCGLTIANNAPEPVANTINPTSTEVTGVATDIPEEVEFPIIPEVADAAAPVIPSVAEESLSNIPEGSLQQGRDDNVEVVSIPRKLEVATEEPVVEPTSATGPETWSPITTEAAQDLGITPNVDSEPVDQPTSEPEPTFESRIPDVGIPSEADFDTSAPNTETAPGSFVELANPGSEKQTLEASGILLDILGEEKSEQDSSHEVSTTTDKPLDPVKEPEIPAKTETKEEDDIYKLPSEVRVGLRNKRVSKEAKEVPKQVQTSPEPEPDPRTEKKIEKLEEKIAAMPEPVVKIAEKEVSKYDPDTIEKAKVIKDYFSTAIEKDKKAKKTKATTKKKHKAMKNLLYFSLALLVVLAIGIGAYFGYRQFLPSNQAQLAKETASFSTTTPTYVPEGYALTTSSYSDKDKTFQMRYNFVTDASRTILYKQIKTDDAQKYIADYIAQKNATFVQKDVEGVTYTEVDKTDLLWSKNGFAFVIETKNYLLSTDLLYKMAGSVQ